MNRCSPSIGDVGAILIGGEDVEDDEIIVLDSPPSSRRQIQTNTPLNNNNSESNPDGEDDNNDIVVLDILPPQVEASLVVADESLRCICCYGRLRRPYIVVYANPTFPYYFAYTD